jgi:hypothetical protein
LKKNYYHRRFIKNKSDVYSVNFPTIENL